MGGTGTDAQHAVFQLLHQGTRLVPVEFVAVAAQAETAGWGSALLVSDPWHSLRARTMARDAGLDAWASPTRSGPIVQTRETQARYIVRETGALLFYRLTHASVETPTSGLG